MPKLTSTKFNLPDIANLPDAVFDGGFHYNEMSDLVPVTFMGNTVMVDFGTDDTITGTSFNDRITVHNGTDTVHAGLGNDIMVDLGAGNDQFFGEGGSDTFRLGSGNDFADGGAGKDTLDYNGIDFTVIADLNQGFILAEGIDQVESVENIIASEWNDTLMGNSADNVFWGMDGNDKLKGGGGRDSLYGGNGDDTINGSGGLYGGTGNDIITSDYRRRGAQGDLQYGEAGEDIMTGSNANDRMYGGADDDVMNGGSGEDFIHGGTGENDLTGGLDRDVFAFQSFGAGHGFDRIRDFELAYDKIDLSEIDADPLTAGKQDFHFSNRALRFDDDVISYNNSPVLDGSTGRVSSKIADGHTYIYVQTDDDLTAANIILDGEFKLTADHFIL
jgi:Ca2+-binding RTX toxin-like protein